MSVPDTAPKVKNYGAYEMLRQLSPQMEEHSPMDVLKETRMGYYSFCSNLDVDPQELYLEYKRRWDIEECFSYLKNSAASSASYAHSDDYFRDWTFLNHISLLYFY